jgi:outer membrane biosynthesis protein TonB
MTSDEKRNSKKSAWITAVIQLILLVVLYFVVAWKEPFPPIPEFGITLEMGSMSSPVPSSTTQVEEVEDQSTSATQQPEASETEASETVPTDDLNSPDVREELSDTEEMTEESLPEQAEISNQQDEISEESEVRVDEVEQNEMLEEDIQEEKVVDERSLYPGTQSSSEGTEGENEGTNLQMSGWKIQYLPQPDDKSSEEGKIVFQIRVDEDGYVIAIETLTSTVTPGVERVYRSAVEQIVLERTADQQSAPVSVGTITFIIKSF